MQVSYPEKKPQDFMAPPMILRNWKELFRMFRVWQNQPLSGKMFSSESTVHGCQKFGHIVTKCPEKRAPKAKGGESKASWK